MKTAVICAVVYPFVALCVAVIIVCPALRMFTVRTPEISATEVLLLVNMNMANGFVLFETGFVKLNDASPYVRDVIEKFDNVGVIEVIRCKYAIYL